MSSASYGVSLPSGYGDRIRAVAVDQSGRDLVPIVKGGLFVFHIKVIMAMFWVRKFQRGFPRYSAEHPACPTGIFRDQVIATETSDMADRGALQQPPFRVLDVNFREIIFRGYAGDEEIPVKWYDPPPHANEPGEGVIIGERVKRNFFPRGREIGFVFQHRTEYTYGGRAFS